METVELPEEGDVDGSAVWRTAVLASFLLLFFFYVLYMFVHVIALVYA